MKARGVDGADACHSSSMLYWIPYRSPRTEHDKGRFIGLLSPPMTFKCVMIGRARGIESWDQIETT